MSIQGFSIKRPVATLTILAVFVVVGAVSMSQTPLDLLPDIQPPVLAVVTSFPGASPQEVLAMVTRPMEDQLALTGGLNNMTSISQEGVSIVILRFDWGSDMSRSREEAESYLDFLPLPEGARPPMVIEFDPTMLPVLELAVTGGIDRVELTHVLKNQVAPRLESVQGVANVQVMGGAEEDVFVRLSPSLMEEYKISYDQVAGILATSLMDMPAGIVELEGRLMRLRFLAYSHAEQHLDNMIVGFLVDQEELEKQLNRSINVDLNQALSGSLPGYGSIDVPTMTIYAGDLMEDWETDEEGQYAFITVDESELEDYGLTVGWLVASLEDAGFEVEWDPEEGKIKLAMEDLDWNDFMATPVATVPDIETWYNDLRDRTRRQLDMTSRQLEQMLVEMAMAMVLSSQGGGAIPGMDDDFPLQPVYLGDIATVERAVHPPNTISRIDRQDSIGLTVQKEGNANTVAVVREVRTVLAELEEEFGLNFYPVFDQAGEIESALNDLFRDLITGGILAIMVLMIFLKDFRTTLFIGVAIPASILFTFTLLYFADLTVNIMTLGGLALAAGLLVDNAIVVSENIYRHLQEGTPPREAALNGSREVAGAIIASTLTTVSVFFPVVFISGLAGELFREFALTVSCALLGSLVISFTLIPLMASRFLRLRPAKNDKKDPLLYYRRGLDWCLSRIWVPLAVALVVIVFAGIAFGYMGTDLFPVTDEDSFVINFSLPPGSPLADTNAYLRQLEEILEGRDELESFSARAGAAQLFGVFGQGGVSNQGRIRVVVAPAHAGDIYNLMNELRQEMERINPDIDLYFNRESLLDTAGMEARLELVIEGDDQQVIQEIAQQINERLSALTYLSDIQFTLEANRPEIHVRMNHQQALQQGVSVYQVANTLRMAMEGMPVARVIIDGEVLNLVLEYDKNEISTLEDVRNIGIYSGMGDYLNLGDVAEFTQDFGPASISRENRKTIGEINAQYYGIDMAAATNRALEAVEDIELPAGYKIRPSGSFSMMDDVFSELDLVLMVAAVLVYLVMAAQFESFLNPFIIITSLPMAFAGSVFALLITGNTISVPAMIGAVVLAGILVNDGIILVDLMNQKYRFQQVPLRQAVLEGAAARVRPVLMTTITTVLGLTPLALGLGAGSQLQAPMAIAIIGGQVVGTMLLLVVIPVLFWTLNGLRKANFAAQQ